MAGCSRPHDAGTGDFPSIAADAKPVIGDWVVLQLAADPETLNPVTGNDDFGDMVRTNIFEGMLVVDNYTLKLKPLLAESWEISPDQLTYTFHLRHGVKWQDGTPFTAEDVKFTYDKVQDPKVDAGDLRSYFNTIKSCEVLDPYTVRFITTERYFKTLEELGGLPIIPKHAFDTGNPDFNQNGFGRAPIGTGPYRFVRWDTGSQIVLQRNDAYWGDQAHYPSRLVYRVIQEPYVAAQLLKKGEIDVVESMAPVQWEREMAHSRSVRRLDEVVYPYPAYSYLGLNLRLPIFSDVRVRHAVDLLIPRDKILTEIFLNKYANKTSGYEPLSSPDYNHAIAPTAYDPAQALLLLTAAGWKNDHGDGLLYKDGQPLSFTLLFPAGRPDAQKIAELVQESLRRDGIDMKLSSLQFAQLVERLEDWKFDATMLSWSLPINSDPYQIWDGSQADMKKSSNFIGYKNPAADKLIAAGRLEYDDNKRAAIYRQLQQVIHDDYPVCFLFNPHQIMVVSKRFQNVRIFAPRPCFDISTWWVPAALQKYK